MRHLLACKGGNLISRVYTQRCSTGNRDGNPHALDELPAINPAVLTDLINSRMVGNPETSLKRGCRKQRTRFWADRRLHGSYIEPAPKAAKSAEQNRNDTFYRQVSDQTRCKAFVPESEERSDHHARADHARHVFEDHSGHTASGRAQGLDGVRNVARPVTVRLRPNPGQRKR